MGSRSTPGSADGTDLAPGLALAVVYAAALGWLANYHQVVITTFPHPGTTAEWDFFYSYVRDAHFILRGWPPLDEFRGPLYPLLLAAAKTAIPSMSLLWHAKMISVLSAAGALLAVYLLASELLERAWALAAAAATACFGPFVLHSFLAGTDMLFACLGLITMAFLARAMREGGRAGWAALAGVACGLALVTRWNAVVLFAGPLLVLGTLSVRERTCRRHAAAFALAALVVASPWWAFNAWQHGSPFHNLNYRNAANGLSVDASHADSFTELLRQAPATIAARWSSNIVAHAVAVGRATLPFSLASIPGLALLALRGRRRRAFWVYLSAAVPLLVANATTLYIDRQYLFLIPAVFVAAAAGFRAAAARAVGRAHVAVRAACAVLWIAAALLLLSRAVGDVRGVLAAEREDWNRKWSTMVPSGEPVAGDWDGDGRDGVGIVRDGSNYRVFYLFDSLGDGPADEIAAYGPVGALPLAGDWDGDGRDTPGIFVAGAFFLKDTPFIGGADHVFTFGEATATPIVGDWTGLGRDSVGVRSANRYYFANGIAPPCVSAKDFEFGPPDGAPVVGDWDGDGRDTLGVFASGTLYVSDRPAPPFDDVRAISVGVAEGTPLAGDWDGDGRDTLALYADGVFSFFSPDGTLERQWRVPFDNLTDLPTTGE